MISNGTHEVERVGKDGKHLLKITNLSTGMTKTIELKSFDQKEDLIDLIFNRGQ